VKPLTVRERMRERERAEEWIDSMSSHDLGELGDEFVLGTFDWRDWLNSKPSGEFLRAADERRIYREIMAQ
jgi:hypothetical protein